MRRALYKIDDSDNPGMAIVELEKKKFEILGYRIWRVRVIEVVRQSTFVPCKVGRRFDVSEKHLSFD